MVAQAAAVKAAKQQERTQAENKGNAESVREYARMLDEGTGISFTVSGSRVRGYVPSQAGLAGLNNNRASWQNIYQRCVNETKKNHGGKKSDKIKALKIAQKIADGKRVPPEDEEFLMQYSITLWAAAKRLALMKERDEKMEESELKEERHEEISEQREIPAEQSPGNFTEHVQESAETEADSEK